MSVKKQVASLLSAMVVALGAQHAGALAAEPAGHSHEHADAPTKLSLNAGKKWSSDAPLR